LDSALRSVVTNRRALIELTGQCICAGVADQAEQRLQARHDAATDPAQRLELLDVWVWAARAAGRLENLKQTLANAHSSQPESAVAALEFALHSANDFSAKRKAVAEATRLASDPALLREVVRSQEQAREWQLALAAADRWQTTAPSAEALCWLAALHLGVGSPTEGWRLASLAATDPQVSADDLQRIGEVACLDQDWRLAEIFLAQAAAKFPRHVALRVMHAVAAEECGDDAVAVREFLAILTLKEPVFSPMQRSWIRLLPGTGEPSDLPAGTDDLVALESWETMAYLHRESVSLGESSWQRDPDKVVQLPATSAEMHAFAMLHLKELTRLGAADPQEIEAAVRAAGCPSLALFFQSVPDPSRYPDDQSLHAWALNHWSFQRRPDHTAIARRCLNLFAGVHPSLAFKAAFELSKDGADEPLQQKAFEQFTIALEQAPLATLQQARNIILDTKSWKNASLWQNAIIGVQTKILAETPDRAGQFQFRNEYQRNRHECVHALLATLEASGRWEDYARVIEAEALQHPIAEQAVEKPSMLLDERALGFPNIITRWPGCVMDLADIGRDPFTRSTRAASARQWTPYLRDPWLKLIAQRHNSDANAARAEMEKRLAAPDAGLAEWWFGAWFAWDSWTVFPDEENEQSATRLAAERLAVAAGFNVEGESRTRLDAALLRAVLALKERSPELLKAARAAAGRLSGLRLTSTYEVGQLVQACEQLGFAEEARAAAKCPLQPSIREALQYEPRLVSPTTASALYQNARETSLSDNTTIATQQLLRSLRIASSTRPSMDSRLIQQAKDRKLTDAVLAAIMPPKDATAREHVQAGRIFELLNEKDRAVTQYEEAANLRSADREAHARLVKAYLPDHPDLAFQHLQAMDTVIAAMLFDQMLEVPLPVRTDLAAQWLDHLTESAVKLPDGMVAIQRLIAENPTSPKHPALWAAAVKHPVLVERAIPAMADDALRRNQPLADIAKRALAYLDSKDNIGSTYGIQYHSEARPREGIVTMPKPLLIVIWDAWQRQAPNELDDISALHDKDARLGADLFFGRSERFIETARAFLRSDPTRTSTTGSAFTDVFFKGGTLDFISLVWRLRKLKVPLEDLFLDELCRPEANDTSAEALATYLDLEVPSHGTIEPLLRKLRDQWVSPDPVRRRTLLHATVERNYYEPRDTKWRRTLAIPPQVKHYNSLLRHLLQRPNACRAALVLAEEDGLMSNRALLGNADGLFSLHVDTKPADLLALMDGYSLLGEAADFRTWGNEADPSSSIFYHAVNTLFRSEEVCKAALEMLKARKPGFGRDLALAWHDYREASDEARRFAVMERFLTGHGKALAQIPTQRWPEMAPLFSGMTTHRRDAFGQWITWQRPWTVRSPEHATLAPLAEMETRHLIHVAEQVLPLQHWEDLGKSGYQFCEQTSNSFIVLASKDPAKALKLADHVLSLLANPSKLPGPRDVNTPTDLHLEWIARSAQSTIEAIDILTAAMKVSTAVAKDSPDHRGRLEKVVSEARRANCALHEPDGR